MSRCLELPPEHPALVVDVLDAELVAAELVLAGRRIQAGLGERSRRSGSAAAPPRPARPPTPAPRGRRWRRLSWWCSRTLSPRRGREARLAGRQLLGPDDDLLTVLPLEKQHLVGDLNPILVDLEGSEDGVQIQLQDPVPDLRTIQRAGALGSLNEDLTHRVAARRLIREIRPGELPPVGFHELPGPRILAGDRNQPAGPEGHQLRSPRRRAVDELRGTPERLVADRWRHH